MATSSVKLATVRATTHEPTLLPTHASKIARRGVRLIQRNLVDRSAGLVVSWLPRGDRSDGTALRLSTADADAIEPWHPGDEAAAGQVSDHGASALAAVLTLLPKARQSMTCRKWNSLKM